MTTKVEYSSIQLASAANIRKIWGGLFINVKEYGAIGDGKHDDTIPFQTAISRSRSLPRPLPIYVPAGNYKITSQLDVAFSEFYMFGDSKLSIIDFFASADHQSCFRVYAPNPASPIFAVGFTNITISANNSSKADLAGITFDHVGLVELEDVRIYGGTSYADRRLQNGINIIAGSDHQYSNIRIESCGSGIKQVGSGPEPVNKMIGVNIFDSYIYTCGEAITTGAFVEGILASNLIMFGSNDYCVTINGDASSFSTVFKFFGCDFDTSKGGLYASNAGNIVISNCWFSSITGVGEAGVITKNVDGLIFSNNQGYMGTSTDIMIVGDTTYYCRNFTISGNQFYGFRKGIFLRSGASRGSISGNTLQGGSDAALDMSENPASIRFGANAFINNAVNVSDGSTMTDVLGEINGIFYNDDFRIRKGGKGIVVTSPDGLTIKRIGIDNAGNIVATNYP